MPTKSQLMTIGFTMAALAVINNVKGLAPVKSVIGLGGGLL